MSPLDRERRMHSLFICLSGTSPSIVQADTEDIRIGISRIRSAGGDSNRQRCAVLDSCAMRTVQTCCLVDSSRLRPERIQPGRPDQNGRHERMHSTLKAETAKPPRASFRAQQRAFDRFRKEYNEIRPHEALAQKVPASRYQPSNRPYPRQLPQLEYSEHFYVAQTYPNGMLSFESKQWYISSCLKSERVGLEQVDDDRWKVHFGPIPLGILDVRNAKERGYRAVGLLVAPERRSKRPYKRRGSR